MKNSVRVAICLIKTLVLVSRKQDVSLDVRQTNLLTLSNTVGASILILLPRSTITVLEPLVVLRQWTSKSKKRKNWSQT